jgi:hypothetical protein
LEIKKFVETQIERIIGSVLDKGIVELEPPAGRLCEIVKGLGSNESSNVSRRVDDPARRRLFNLGDVNRPHRMKVQESHQMHQNAGGGPHRRATDAILQQVSQVLLTFR